jgi:hypothetical protein
VIDAFVQGVQFESQHLEFGRFLVPESSPFALDDEPVLIFGNGLSKLIVHRNVHRLGSEFVDPEHLDETALVLPHLEVATVPFLLLALLKETALREGHFGVEEFRLKLDGIESNKLEETDTVVVVSLK